MNLIFLEPLDQFEVIYLGTIKGYTVNNFILYMFFGYIIFRFFFKLSLYKRYLVPHNWQYVAEFFFSFILSMVKQQIGKKGFNFLPLVFTLFIFLFVSNLLGMTIYSFTITSHIILTFSLSSSIFIGIIITGFLVHGWRFIYIFVPGNAPKALLPLLIFIEIVSFFSRPFSLAIRLFANMMSGHTLLAILSNFTLIISQNYFFTSIIPFLLITVIVGLELMIAGLQAYVFSVLICIYINDSLEGGH